MQKTALLDQLLWRDVPDEACRLAKEAAGPYQVIQDLMPSLPNIRAKVWYNPDKEDCFFTYPSETDTDKVASWYIAMRQVPGVETVTHGYFSIPPVIEPYVQVKEALENKEIFGPIASSMQLKPNSVNNLFGGPNPLAATLAGGALGAGAGYVGGWLGEQLLPEKYFDKGRLRRVTAALGGLAGATPGLWWAGDNLRMEGLKGLISSHPFAKPNRYEQIKESMAKVFDAKDLELNEDWIKYADEAGGAFLTSIPVDQFGQVIWNDLRNQGGYTPAPLAAATTGLIQAADMSQGNSGFVSPMDIARIGIGMGSGYASGLLVGKTLGALAGLRPEAQQSLQQTGVWAGMLKTIVPMMF